MTKWDKKHYTDEQKEKIRFDRHVIKMTYAELKAKWGGSLGGLQRICKGAN